MEDVLQFLGIILGLALAIVLIRGWHGLCTMYSNIAANKKFDASKFYWLCFLFGLPAMLLIVSMSENKAPDSADKTPMEQVDIPNVNKS